MKLKPYSALRVTILLLLIGNISQASVRCDYGGLQVALRNGADSLHPQNPVTYIDFANDAPFGYALRKMAAVGVPPRRVQVAWVNLIKNLCGSRANRLSVNDVGPTQHLSGLMNLLGLFQ